MGLYYYDQYRKAFVPSSESDSRKMVVSSLERVLTDSVRNLVEQKNKAKESIEQSIKSIVPLNSGTIEPLDYSKLNIITENGSFTERFFIGEKYSLKSPSCEGFEMKEKVYELVGIVDKFSDIAIDSVVVKQISGDKDLIFSLSKNDCAHLGIEYQPELQLFPKAMSWNKVIDNEFDKNDLSTTPRSDIDNKIRYLLLKVTGFKDYHDGFILSPSGKLFKENELEKRLIIKAKEPLVFGNGYVKPEKSVFLKKIVRPEHILFNHGNDISSDNEFFVKVILRTDKCVCFSDGFCGVDPKYLKSLKIEDILEIGLDETELLTANQYEEEKKKEEEKRKEELRKKQEAERKAKEVTKRINEKAVERMSSNPFLDIDFDLLSEDKLKGLDELTRHCTSLSDYIVSMPLDVINESIYNRMFSGVRGIQLSGLEKTLGTNPNDFVF